LTAKDFRTLRGTIVAAQSLARSGIPESDKQAAQAITAAVQATADVLGNTTAVARKSYVDPRLFDQFRAGRLLDLRRSPEAALRAILEG
jgi:DNA topoisomerase IB